MKVDRKTILKKFKFLQMIFWLPDEEREKMHHRRYDDEWDSLMLTGRLNGEGRGIQKT